VIEELSPIFRGSAVEFAHKSTGGSQRATCPHCATKLRRDVITGVDPPAWDVDLDYPRDARDRAGRVVLCVVTLSGSVQESASLAG
jgi:hypothetical protein